MQERQPWLIMVYMQAGDNSNLDSLAVQDLKELQASVQGLKDPNDGGNPDVSVLVQMRRRWPGCALSAISFRRASRSRRCRQPTDGHMATKASLSAFLSDALAMGGSTVEHHCLVLWGHNYGLGFGRDHDDPLQLKELAAALKVYKTGRGKPLDLLATNSCTMAYAEAAFELREAAEYLVASQVLMPLAGFPYFPILRSIDQ